MLVKSLKSRFCISWQRQEQEAEPGSDSFIYTNQDIAKNKKPDIGWEARWSLPQAPPLPLYSQSDTPPGVRSWEEIEALSDRQPSGYLLLPIQAILKNQYKCCIPILINKSILFIIQGFIRQMFILHINITKVHKP